MKKYFQIIFSMGSNLPTHGPWISAVHAISELKKFHIIQNLSGKAKQRNLGLIQIGRNSTVEQSQTSVIYH